MLVDLALTGKNALIIGRGDEARIRAKQLLAEGARVAILSDDVIRESEFRKARNLEILTEGLERWKSVLQKVRPFVVVVSTGKLWRDEKIAKYAHGVSNLVYVVDRPNLNDINMTGVAKLGDVRVAVSTQGLSPAMAGILRRRIESIIAPEDILLVKLQGEVRSTLKSAVRDPERRKKLVYKLIHDKRILSSLRSKKFEQARSRALELITKNSRIAVKK
jgi:siroheme synthase-like protein